MIQSPQTQYIPAGEAVQNYNQQPVAYSPVQYNQTPGVIYNYPTTSCYLPQQQASYTPKSQYNGVNIEILNPQGVAGQNTIPNQSYVPAQYVPINQVPVYQPQYINQAPVQPQEYPQTQVQTAPQVPQAVTPQIVIPQTEQEQPAAAQQVIPQTPEPVIDQPSVQDTSNLVPSFTQKLQSDDLDVQKAAIEEIAENVKNNDTTAPILLDTQIYDALVGIINKDTSALEGPSPEVVELRQKPQEELSEEEKAKASTPSPLEKAEINKQYALYTISFMTERLNNELEKKGGTILELKDIPCIENVVDAVKENPNPMIRIGAIASLSHIQKPEYKEDLTTIFNLAKSDEDEGVREAAEKALTAIGASTPAAEEASEKK